MKLEKYNRKIPFITVLFLLLSACNSMLYVENRIKYAQELTQDTSFSSKTIKTEHFSLFSYQKISDLSNKSVSIYIEGDGLAWKSRYQLSNNPTPTDPISLKMALVDKALNIVYLARPCQYINIKLDKNCQNREYWSRARFSKEVVASIDAAVDNIKREFGFKNINLYGFSGGGGLAILVAAMRNDVKLIKTVAANLDHEELTKIHQTTPLNQSLNPSDYISKIANIDQLHIAGLQDKTVPHQVIESFVKKVNNYSSGLGNVKISKAEIKIISEADHEYKKWPEVWSKVINK